MSELESLRAQIQKQQAEIEVLSGELVETNRGVVALYAELDNNAAMLREAADLKSRFLSYMSHEFRTPLASITGITELLANGVDGVLNAEQQRQVQFVRSSVRDLTEMVDDLLDLAKVEAGRITISPEWFEMVDLFSALRGIFKPIVASSTVSLIFEEPEDLPRIFTDDKKLSQILRNFISNALKFTAQGEVRVSAHLREGARVEFAVRDTGIGISSEQLPVLFNDFVQIDTRVQKRLRGTGLGLSLARKFSQLLGGEVGVQSELGKGSCFSVTIPVHYQGAGKAASS